MKLHYWKLIPKFTLIPFLFLCSCQQEMEEMKNDSDFSIEFSNGSILHESDLLYYDLSTHMVYLKKGFNLQSEISSFKVIVDKDTIYQGVIHPSILSSRPNSIFISDIGLYGTAIFEISNFQNLTDKRSDARIIHALEESNLLHHGIQCSIDEIQVTTFSDHSKVNCTITISNNDRFNYYILDPKKMGELKFNYYTNGLLFQNVETHLGSFLRWSTPCDWSNLSINDLSLLKGGEKISYTFESSDYHKMDQGTYKANFNFCGAEHNAARLVLNQKNGRIWLGRIKAESDIIHVD